MQMDRIISTRFIFFAKVHRVTGGKRKRKKKVCVCGCGGGLGKVVTKMKKMTIIAGLFMVASLTYHCGHCRPELGPLHIRLRIYHQSRVRKFAVNPVRTKFTHL